MMKLYRATRNTADAQCLPVGSCWTSDLGTAQAYTDNPGFGGPEIVSIEVDGESVADVRGKDANDLEPLADLLGLDRNDWRDSGYMTVYQVIENSARARKALMATGATWLRYYDDYPADADVWMRITA